MSAFWIPILLLAIILEGSLTFLPLVFLVLLVLAVKERESWIFSAAFFAGIILDVFYLKTVGTTSIFFLSFLFLVLLYQRKFEIATYTFIAVSSFLGSALYLFLFGYGNVILASVLSSLIALVLFQFSITNSQFTIKFKN